MELREYLQILRNRLWLIVAGTILFGVIAFVIYSSQEPIYRATATLLVAEGGFNPGNEATSLHVSERLARSYVERLSHFEVLSAAVRNLGLRMTLDELKRNVNVRLLGDTQLIELSVENTDPRVAQRLANEIPEVFAERNSEQQLERFTSYKANLEGELDVLQEQLMEAEAVLDSERNQDEPDPELIVQLQSNVTRLRDTYTQLLRSYEQVRLAEATQISNIIIDERARLPREPQRPRILRQTILAALLGGVLSASLVLLHDYLDNTVKSPEEIRSLTDLGTLGFIPDDRKIHQSLVTITAPRSPAAEAYRHLRTNLLFSLLSRNLKSILITSSNQGEGKTTTAANLAIALSQTGKKVILVDADLRKPELHTHFDTSNKNGLTGLMLNKESESLSLQETGVDGLFLLTSGPLPPNPAELLGSDRMKQIAALLKERADYVIYDGPPALAVTDAALLARIADTMVVVSVRGQTVRQALQAAVEQLRAAGSHIAGVVLNRVSARDSYYYDYSYSENGYGMAETRIGRNDSQSPFTHEKST